MSVPASRGIHLCFLVDNALAVHLDVLRSSGSVQVNCNFGFLVVFKDKHS